MDNFKQGKLTLGNNSLFIPVQFNRKSTQSIQLDTGCSITQFSLDFAKELGLKSHPKLIGRSTIGNGEMKYDYLCLTIISILDLEATLLVKIAENQPYLLGLDAICKFGMDINVRDLSFRIENPLPKISYGFNFINFFELMKKLKLSNNDLIEVDQLPPIDESVKQLQSLGQSNLVIDLGTSFTTVHQTTPSFIDLGCTY